MKDLYFCLSLLLLCLISGCGETPQPEEERVVYVDRKTKEVFILEDSFETPAVNPKTGKRTLLRGLYCPECEKWYAVPPLEVIRRNPKSVFCPKDKTKMVLDGVVPESS